MIIMELLVIAVLAVLGVAAVTRGYDSRDWRASFPHESR